MRATRVLSMVLLTAALALVGCDKKADGKAGDKAGDKKAAAAKGGDKGGLPSLSAGDFYKDFTSLKGMAVMKKYGKVEVRARMPAGDWLWPGESEGGRRGGRARDGRGGKG